MGCAGIFLPTESQHYEEVSVLHNQHLSGVSQTIVKLVSHCFEAEKQVFFDTHGEL